MAGKNDLTKMLNTDTAKPLIRRGQGMSVSTEQAAPNNEEAQRIIAETQNGENTETQNSESANTQESESAETQRKRKRVNRGYMLREDLIKACKRLALDEDRNLYEVMEDALEEYLERHRVENT